MLLFNSANNLPFHDQVFFTQSLLLNLFIVWRLSVVRSSAMEYRDAFKFLRLLMISSRTARDLTVNSHVFRY